MNKKEEKALREKILKKVAESNDTDAMAKILTEYEKAHANEIQWAEILKIVAILAAAGISAATTVYVAKLTLSAENGKPICGVDSGINSPGLVKSKVYPYKPVNVNTGLKI